MGEKYFQTEFLFSIDKIKKHSGGRVVVRDGVLGNILSFWLLENTLIMNNHFKKGILLSIPFSLVSIYISSLYYQIHLKKYLKKAPIEPAKILF